MKSLNSFHLMNSWCEANLYLVALDDWKIKLLTCTISCIITSLGDFQGSSFCIKRAQSKALIYYLLVILEQVC